MSLCMVTGLFGAKTVMNTEAATTVTDIAEGKTVYCSSSITNYEGQYAVDGNSATKWVSQAADNQWIIVDLGAIYNVASLRLVWGEEYPTKYTVSWAQELGDWHDAITWGSGLNGQMGEKIHMFYDRPVRYIKVQCNIRGTQYGISLYDFNIYGELAEGQVEPTTAATETTTVPETTVIGAEVTNLALGKYVLSSSNETNDLMAEKAVDGDMNTRWSSAFIDNQWIMVDLGDIYTVGTVKLFWEDAYASKYTIQWSQDGETWYDACTSYINSPGETVNMMYNRPARYIKIIGDERATEYGISLYELEIYGTK